MLLVWIGMSLLRLTGEAALFAGGYALWWLAGTSQIGHRIFDLLIVHLR